MNCERVFELLPDHIKGSLETGDEELLSEHLAACVTCRHQLDELQEMWTVLGELPEERSNERVRSRFYAMLAAEEAMAQRRGLREWIESWWPRNPVMQLGAAVATLIVGLLIGATFGGARERGEIDSIRADMQSMTRAVTLSLMEHQSASERLRAVTLSQTAERDSQVISALLRAVDEDSSVNVRLAALDVLSEMVQRTDVRDGLLESFPKQESPMMQVALADVLAEMNGPRSTRVIRELLERDELDDTVRGHLERTLAQGKDRT